MDNKQLAVAKKTVKDLIISDNLDYPENYSPQNAVNAAWLVLQETLDRNKQPVLKVCTQVSIINAVRSMAVLGLMPLKKQCDFIAYGKKLTCQISYFGRMAVTLQLTDAADITAEVVYQGDGFEYSIEGGNKRVISHTQKLGNINKDKIIAAYCTITRKDHAPRVEIMTIDQIEAAWTMSRSDVKKETGPHQKFKDQMCKRTVVSRACKYLLNSSDDSGLRMQKYREAEEVMGEAVFDEKVEDEANRGEVIDISPAEPDESPQQLPEPDGQEEAAEQAGGPGF